MKKFILLLILASIVPTAALAIDQPQDNPHWTVEVKGGKFAPALADWATFYGKRDMTEYGASLAYKLLRQIDIGVEAGAAKTKGQAFAPIHGTAAGDVTYEVYPVNVFVLLRGVLNDGQWFVPYAGGGFTRMYYREKVEGQDTAKGSADGYHVRGGMQFLLDGLDRSGATSMYMDYGVYHTYFFIEAENTSAKVKSISTDIGGTTYAAGFLFEF